ncbi:MAG: dihydroxyacetone kinase subunit L [Chloroflexi bacterium]|nr:dihydroxyacetone kinase subunit L [Chloroflexota bacterium]
MFDLKKFRTLFSLLSVKFNEQCQTLNNLDAAVGDGDHGFTISRAFAAADYALRNDYVELGSLLDAVAESLAENAGGAIGPLLAAFFAEGGIVLRGKQGCSQEDLAQFFEGGLNAVMQVGGAQPGQKTLVDAIFPAVQALQDKKYPSLADALGAAEEAAREGMLSTQGMVAVHGRAHFLGERSKGYQDAGATSFALIVSCFKEAEAGRKVEIHPRENSATGLVPSGKFINRADTMIAEDNEGLAWANAGILTYLPEGFLVRTHKKEPGKVGLAIGHGGGHTPSMGGLVGKGLLDSDVYGPIFTCASGVKIARAIELADRGAGVALLISNHSGDVLNARLGIRRAEQLGIPVEPISLGDDIATAPRAEFTQRRGLGGLLFALKIGGAAAENGKSLAEVAGLMRKTNQRTATLAVAVRPPTHPATGVPLFEMPAGQVEIGTGVHGEVGVYRGDLLPADEIVDLLLAKLVADLADFTEKQVLVFVNGSGGTSRMELDILYRRAHQALHDQGFLIAGSVVDSLFTTQEMGGFSLSLCVVDKELLDLWNEPASAACFRWPIC